MLMLITSVAGPILTGKFARNLFAPETEDFIEPIEENKLDKIQIDRESISNIDAVSSPQNRNFTVVVPIANQLSGIFLVKIAAIIARHESGDVVPLSIVKAHVHMDAPELDIALKKSDHMLSQAIEPSKSLEIPLNANTRIDDDIAEGISRTAKENQANLLVMGWSRNYTIKARLFGSLIDKVFWSSHCPIVVSKLLVDPAKIKRILVPIKIINLKSIHAIRFASILADSNQASITLFHVYDLKMSRKQIKRFSDRLESIMRENPLNINFEIKKIRHNNASEAILHTARKYDFDLVVLRSVRRRSAGGLWMSDVTTQVMQKLKRSFIIFGEPN